MHRRVIVANAVLLSNDNIKSLEANGYEYILGTRLKNESEKIKSSILQVRFTEGTTISFLKTK